MLLGEPGAGKTTNLRKCELELWRRWEADARQPVPLFVPLNEWTDAQEALPVFIAREIGLLGPYLPTLLTNQRVALLLDGLDQVPRDQREAKDKQVVALFKEHRRLLAVVSCRKHDWSNLDFDQLLVKPLDATRIRGVARRFLAQWPGETDVGDAFFWEVAGGEPVRHLWLDWEAEGGEWGAFWHGSESVFQRWDRRSREWQERVRAPSALMALAENPFNLTILLILYAQEGRRTLPTSRAQLFEDFVDVMLAEEAKRAGKRRERWPGDGAMLDALERLAWTMQRQRGADRGTDDARTILSPAAAERALGSADLLRMARSAGILAPDNPVRFSHQLLQEYFAARTLRRRMAARWPWQRLPASRLWPRRAWWESTGWDEAVIFLAGLHPDDATPVLEWLDEASPRMVARCINESGVDTSDETLRWLRERWKPRLDPAREPQPYARAAVGDALATVTLDGRMLDDRPGVGLRADGLPDIAWVKLPGGDFPIGDGQRARIVTLPTFWMARYPITNAQWQAFLDDREGYHDERWWKAASVPKQQPAEPRWREGNHPRETVNWYEAMAFCAWLGHRLRLNLALPTEEQWERAARGREGRIYPWGSRDYQSGYANVDERLGSAGPLYLRRTSPVGIYPQGATPSPESLHELAGNVWEWCRHDDVMSTSAAPLRGGSWNDYPQFARAASRYDLHPRNRYDFRGFRVVSLSSPSAPAVVSDL